MSRRSARGVSHFEAIEAVLRDAHLYRERPDTRDATSGGRPRVYQNYVADVYHSLVTIYGSARKVDTELHSPDRVVWAFMSRIVREMNPNNPEMHLPSDPPSRPWWIKRRNQSVENGLDEERAVHTAHAVDVARELGLCDPAGFGSATHPDKSRMLYGDGKVIKSLFNSVPGETRDVKTVDVETGEVVVTTRPVRCDPDVKTHIKGDQTTAVGVKFAHIEVRGEEPHARVILDFDHVPGVKNERSSEADVLLPMILNAASKLPGTQGVLTDTVLRGAHIDPLQRRRGLVVMNPITAKAVNPKTSERTEKEFLVGYETFRYDDGTSEEVELWTHGGRLCRVEFTDDGTRHLAPLNRTATLIRPNKDGTYRSYVQYEVPDPRGGRSKTHREATCGTTKDKGKSKYWRAENIRQVPPGDPDYQRIAGRRSDAESINRHLDDSLYLRRAHSIGAQRQLYDLIAYARTVNALALHRHRKRHARHAAAA